MKTLLKSLWVGALLFGASVVSHGACLQFDGVDDYVQAGAVDLSGGSFTVELWAKRNGTGAYHQFASQGVAASQNNCWQFTFTSSDQVAFTFWGPGVYTPAYPDTDWHHWAAVYNAANSSVSIYRDGSMVAQNVDTNINYQQTGPIYIGRFLDGSLGSDFNGLLDEVRVWNVARSDSQIASVWNRRLSGTGPGLMAYYRMDEGAGATTADSTGHGYTGELMNGVVWNTTEDAIGPLAVTTLAPWITSSSAQLNGLAKPGVSNLLTWFEWGSTTNYGFVTPMTEVASGFTAVPVSAEVFGLNHQQTYHYRLVGSNSLGVSFGGDQAFAAMDVTNPLDSGPGSLRQAMADAAPGMTVFLTNTDTIALTSGELVIDKDLAISGPGASELAISGSHLSRVFTVASNVKAHFSGLTIRDGQAPHGANGSTAGASGQPGALGGGIYNAGSLTLSGCVITNNRAGNGGNGYAGSTGANGGHGGLGGYGGGICNVSSATLTLWQCTVTANSAGNGGNGGNGGGGLSGSISHSATDGGDGGAGGGGGLGGGVYGGRTVIFDKCTLAGNVSGHGGSGGNGGNGGGGGTWRYDQDGGDGGPGGAGGDGGGIWESGQATLNTSTLSANITGAGGAGGSGGHPGTGGLGTASPGTAASGGRGGNGGGLCSLHRSDVYSCTIVYNTAGPPGPAGTYPSAPVGTLGGQGGGVAVTAGAEVAMANTIVGLNNVLSYPLYFDVQGSVGSLGGNLLGNTTGSTGFAVELGDQLNLYPLVGPLADNGGSTWTHALWPESPAVNAGTNAHTVSTSDQRGFPRLVCASVDIGAVEYDGCPLQVHPAARTALYFDGANDYVEATQVPIMNSSFTVEAWAKRDLLGTGDCILGQGTQADGNGLYFGFDPENHFTFGWFANDLETAHVYTDSDWHHWAGTYDTNGRVRLLYQDGVLVASNTASSDFTGTGSLRIGMTPWNAWPFDGEIDEVRVWDRARSAGEIIRDRTQALEGTESGLVAYYRFDEGEGTTTIDLEGTSAALLKNGPVWVLSGARLYRPIVKTLAADAVRATTATLRGTINPAEPDTNTFTTVWFEYGTSLNLGSQTQPQYLPGGLTVQPLEGAISNLDSGTKYYFRLAANKPDPDTPGSTYGETLTFDTLVVGSGYPISTRTKSGESTTSPRHVTDSAGNIYLAGLFSGSTTFKKTLQAAGSGTNAFLAKLARAGDWRWGVNIPVTNGQVHIKALTLDGQDNVLVAGVLSGTATFGTNTLTCTNGTQAFIARFESAATNWAWAFALSGGTTNSANAIAVGGDGSLYVAGEFNGNTGFGTNITLNARGGSDAFVARFSSAGEPDWAAQLGGSEPIHREAATAVAVGPYGEVYATGFYRDQGTFGPYTNITSAGASDVFFTALNLTNGQIQRVVRAGGQGEDRGTALTTDPSGNIYLVSQLAGAANFDGSPLPELDSSGMNLLVTRLNRQGVLSRRAAARGACADSIVATPAGRIYVAGDFTGIMRYGPTLITVGTGTNASSDVFLAQLREGEGDALAWNDFKQIGGIGTEKRGTVSVDPAGSVVVSGTYAQSLHLGYVEVSTPNPQEIFLARLDPDGTYEHNRWEIGKALRPPDEALASVAENRAKGLLSIEILNTPPGLSDSTGGNSFLWNNDEQRLYAIRPVTARIKWRLDQDLTNLANVATMVGRCVWPSHPRTNVAGAPVEVQGPGVGLGYFCAGIAFNTNGANIQPVTRGAQQFQIFQTATNVSGYNVIHYTRQLTGGESAFDVVYTKPYRDWPILEPKAADAGKALSRGTHEDSTGKNGYVLFPQSFYDADAYNRDTRTGPILPVNRNLHNDPDRAMVVVWYRTNAVTGVAWGSDPVSYAVNWGDPPKIVIASGDGAPAGPALYPQAQVYRQPNSQAPGFNPNEEHAFLLGGQMYALRSDLNNVISPRASEPYVLLKYLGPDATNDWRMQVFKVVAEDAEHTFADFAHGEAGLEIQPPAPLSLLQLCASSNRIAFGEAQAHQAWNGKIYAKSAGYFQVQYWYPNQAQFYFGASNPPVGTCVPWMSQYAQTKVTPGATRSTGEPVLVGYTVSWPTEVATLEFGETLTTPAHGLPDLLHFASARVIYDDGSPQGADWAESLVRIFDPISERTVQLAAAFKLPNSIATANDRGRLVFTDLPYPIRIRLFYDSLNQRLSFGGWYDPEFGAGQPLLLPNILSPRERERIKQLDGTNTVSAFDDEIDRLYDLTRNPNQVDVDHADGPDKALRAGLITRIRDGFNEILVGPVIAGPGTNLVTYRTNTLAQPVSARVTNVVQEQFGDLPKAMTAGLRPGSGYITIVENDDPSLPGQPISLHLLYVTNSLFRGDLKVLPSDNVFDERLTLRHSADFGGEPQNYEFEWYYQPDQNGISPPPPVLAAGNSNWNGWIQFPTSPTGTNNGFNDITLGEGNNLSSLLVLSDNWLLCRYRGFRGGEATPWSDWVGAPGGGAGMLAEGWVKRVLSGLNEFDSRTRDFHDAPAATYASMILQAGERYEGPIAFNPDPNYLNSLGLIESYETVLERARKLSIDGAPPVSFGPANNALLRAAGKIADLYMLLGNEAYADASDPTIGFTTSSGEYGNLAPCIFCFQNQLDSPLAEELALLRGRDDSAGTVRAIPYYNRLIWNFTLGEGEVAYKLTYNVSDQNEDGFIDEKDARVLYPQGHGDAWGHYLTAIQMYYELLRHPFYEWVPRPEAVTVGGSPVEVDYLDERKFAGAAAAKAKAGAEIVNLTYREKYVADPAGQWQGYKDTQTDRAWGVSEWATRAGMGAYFDWVVANAILPATDPDTSHVGIQKIDRTTVADLNEIPAQFSSIEAQLDTVDRGLNPLGLAAGAMPFDIDPSKVAEGQTHFDQIYNRALNAMENTLALFDHVNTLSQSLRRNQDDVDNFTANVEEQERDYRNRMIELFGYPYAGDIGPAATYPSGYDGPDLYHYMYVDASNLTGDNTEPDKLITGYYKPLDFPKVGLITDWLFFPDDVEGLTQPALSGDGTFHVQFPMVEDGDYQFQAPNAWGSRRAPGRIQNALAEMLKSRAQLNQARISYDNLRRQILDEVELLEAQADLAQFKVSTKAGEVAKIALANYLKYSLSQGKATVDQAAETGEDVTEAAVESVPKSVGFSTDAFSGLRGTLRTIGSVAWQGLKKVGKVLEALKEQTEDGKSLLESQTELRIEGETQKYEIAQRVKTIEQLCREEIAKRVELYMLQGEVQQAHGAYLSVLAEGQRLQEERYTFRVKTAAQVQEHRYQDMAFRIFQNDALQKYRAQFDLAARYVYLAAKAYDYETCLLNTETGAGSRLLTDIVRQRTLGQLANGVPVSGRQGLADPLARLGQNFEVYRGQLGFTTPETETGRFSIRTELFRVRPGDLQTNAVNGIVSTNQDWNAMLQACLVPDLWKVPEFRRFCRPFAPESAGPQPGLVIRIPTTITFGLNYFGWPLGPGDSAYDSSRFATKVRSAGVWFADYNLAGLSMTPRVYLVPAGTDVLRSPSSDDLQTREFNVVDQKLPVPFPIGASDLSNPSWIPVNDSLSETLGDIRCFSSFRAYHDKGWFDENEATQDTRLIGRSVWNTEWLLIIPGGTFLYDPDKGLDTFVATVGDIKIFFQTYSYSGN